MIIRTCLAAVSLVALAGLAVADEAMPSTHAMMTPDQMKWGEAPPTLPPGAKMAVLYGDPTKPAQFIIRAKFPAGYKIPAHWHPTDENITVISGTFMMGMADKLDPAKAKPYPVGSFINMPAKQHHFAMAKGETIVEISAMGPFVINYLNPADDPSKSHAEAPPAKK